MKVIGLTGGIGSGKSTVAKFLREFGATVMELDKLGHEVMKSGGKVWQELVDTYGKEVIGEDGEIDRSKLGDIVFNDNEALERLNDIMHPEIDRRILESVEKYRQDGVKVLVLVAAVKLGTEKAPSVDEVWLTRAPEEIIIKRLAERDGYSEDAVKARVLSQQSDEDILKYASVVIDTNCSLEELWESVLDEWERLQERNTN